MLDTLIAFMNTPEGSGILVGVLTVWPFWRTFLRAGLNPLWALLVFLPLIGIAAALAALCLQKWPVVRPGGVAHPQGASSTIRQTLKAAGPPAPQHE